MFAHLKNKTDGKPSAPLCTAARGLCETHCSSRYSKDETEKIAFEWQSLLVSAAKGGEPSTYVIEPGIILWSVQVQLRLPSCAASAQPISRIRVFYLTKWGSFFQFRMAPKATTLSSSASCAQSFMRYRFKTTFGIVRLCPSHELARCRWNGRARSTGSSHCMLAALPTSRASQTRSSFHQPQRSCRAGRWPGQTKR